VEAVVSSGLRLTIAVACFLAGIVSMHMATTWLAFAKDLIVLAFFTTNLAIQAASHYARKL